MISHPDARPNHLVPADEVMTGAELRTVTDALGLAHVDLARMLEVHERTIRSWMTGRDQIPEWVRLTVEDWEARTTDEVENVVGMFRDRPGDPVLPVWTDNDEMWSVMPRLHPFPARWWRHVVYRAATELPGARIEPWSSDWGEDSDAEKLV